MPSDPDSLMDVSRRLGISETIFYDEEKAPKSGVSPPRTDLQSLIRLLGYPFALATMMLSAFVPYWWFKRRGWL